MPIATAPDERSLTARPAARNADKSYYDRWIKIWVVLLTLVTLVVVVYLVVITNSLASINKNLGVADRSVTGAGGNVKTLPDQIEIANKNLTGIDTALKPISGQADQIVGALGSINGRLSSVDSSLKNTDGSLQDTDGSLKDTSSVLVSVLRLATGIRGTLIDADDPADKLGVQNIHRRVAVANSVLAPARQDTANILVRLKDVNVHLESICNSAAVRGGPSCNR